MALGRNKAPHFGRHSYSTSVRGSHELAAAAAAGAPTEHERAVVEAVLPVLQEIGTDEEEAAKTLGASALRSRAAESAIP